MKRVVLFPLSALCIAASGCASVESSVTSQCDEHGNRIYVNQHNSNALFVLGADPTCAGASR